MSNVIVVGCGRVGSQLANMLSDNGSNVCVIDRNVDAFANLGRNFNGSTIQGVGFDEETLEKAGIDECDVVAAVTQLRIYWPFAVAGLALMIAPMSAS